MFSLIFLGRKQGSAACRNSLLKPKWFGVGLLSIPVGLTAVITSLLLTGCASLITPATSPLPPVMPSSNRAYHDAIDLNGRLSLHYEQHGQQQAIDGKFHWLQVLGHTSVTILSPFGQIIAVIDVTPQRSTLTQAGHPLRSASKVDLLLAETLGWPLPVAGLSDWLQGFATTDQGKRYIASATDTQDATYVRTADNWLIHYAVWEATSDHYPAPRPKRIDLQRVTPEAGNVSLRIVIDQWQPQ
jgi:outer membrane lipoprotein LolB